MNEGSVQVLDFSKPVLWKLFLCFSPSTLRRAETQQQAAWSGEAAGISPRLKPAGPSCPVLSSPERPRPADGGFRSFGTLGALAPSVCLSPGIKSLH